jgi:hypothetical protein
MKKGKQTDKLQIKKVTLKDLDEPTVDGVVGGWPTPTLVEKTCPLTKCANND